LSVLTAIGLTVYLFVMRKRKEYAAMRALGTPRRTANRSLFIPLSVIAALALIVGNILAYGFAGNAVRDSLAPYTQLGIEADASVPAFVIAVSVICELTALVVITAFGLHRVGGKAPLELLQAETNRNKPGLAVPMSIAALIQSRAIPVSERPVLPVPQREVHGKRGGFIRHVFWYSTRHIRRTPVKMLLSLGLALLLLGTIGQFTVIRGIYQDIYENMEVKSYFLDGLRMAAAVKIIDSGYVTAPYIENTVDILECEAIPVAVVMTNDMTRAAENLNGVASGVTFLRGYDFATFAKIYEEGGSGICVMDSAFMETLGVELGDTVRINRANLRQDLTQIIVTAEVDTIDWREQVDWVERAFQKASVLYTVVGQLAVAEGSRSMIYVPVGDGLNPVYTQAVAIADAIDYSSELTFDRVEFSLTSPRNADKFSELAKKMVSASIGSIGAAGFTFVMDTSEADNILRTINMLDNLYPIAVAVAAIMGSLFPGLIVMQADREAAIMCVLGTTKKRTRLMLTLEQTVLCLGGFVCAVLVLLMINGVLPATVTGPLAVYAALHFAMCIAGALVCAVIVTRRRILELLQVKE
jgi:hypothetical protein